MANETQGTELRRSVGFRSKNEINPYPPTASQKPIRILFLEGYTNFALCVLIFPFSKWSWMILGLVVAVMKFLSIKRIPPAQVFRMLRNIMGQRVCFPSQQQYERNKGIFRAWPF